MAFWKCFKRWADTQNSTELVMVLKPLRVLHQMESHLGFTLAADLMGIKSHAISMQEVFNSKNLPAALETIEYGRRAAGTSFFGCDARVTSKRLCSGWP